MDNQPVIKTRDKSNSVAIFQSEYTTAQGEIKKRFSVSIQRSYKDKNGEWKQTSLNCFIEDLLPLSSLLRNTYIQFNKYLNKIRDNKGNAQQSSEDFDDDIPF